MYNAKKAFHTRKYLQKWAWFNDYDESAIDIDNNVNTNYVHEYLESL